MPLAWVRSSEASQWEFDFPRCDSWGCDLRVHPADATIRQTIGSRRVTSVGSSLAVFDRLFGEAVPELLGGTHRRDEPPVDGGRWPVSVVCLPDAQVRPFLADLMREALVYAGPGHFETGSEDASHFTVRALEPYREAASPDDAITEQWIAALNEVARDTPPIRLRLTGVTLSPSGVMVQAVPIGNAAWELMRRLRAALGPLAWFEDQWQERDIWYASILHFAAPVADAPGLIAWAKERRELTPFEIELDTLSLIRSRYREDDVRRYMAMEPWYTVDLAAASAMR